MKTYRIKELNGIFTIEVLTGFLGIKRWKPADYNGEKHSWFWGENLCHPRFDSLEKAKQQINKWIEKPKYYPYP